MKAEALKFIGEVSVYIQISPLYLTGAEEKSKKRMNGLTAVAAAPAKAPAKACCKADRSEDVASKLLSFSLPIMLSWIVSYTCRQFVSQAEPAS